ncbi:hypothetical protein PVAP13_3KG262156 [Panicum virgatum]|uniref:Uncharacterized protein n=1 Tax=Panicum virgatum TaxID=38727 RepID=A0A8T0V0E2_PANVG|nr:hypothetical protein PVAP13_3KG262156 [Panicum virgatum]
MAGHGRGRISGGGVAGGLGSRQFHQHIHGGNELGHGGDRKLAVHGGQIDGHRGRLEGEGGWIVVRGWRIGRAGFHINSQGEVFAPDSEDEDAMEDVTANKAPGMEGAPGVELPPEVQARLDKVLAGIDPVYHNVFISFYKVMVPAFFKCN